MIEINQQDIWNTKADWLCITTNGHLKKDGQAVMGRGIAKEAVDRFPCISKNLGEAITKYGNVVNPLKTVGVNKHEILLLSFPVKHAWHEQADLFLIEQSALQLYNHWRLLNMLNHKGINVAIPRPGCGNGRLDWSQVKPILENILVEDNFWVYSK